MACTFNTVKTVDFSAITNLLQFKKLNSDQITNLSNVILNANQEKNPCSLSIQELEERITILGKIDNNIAMPERTWYFHICTLFVSYVFSKIFDKYRATDILQQKQNLTEKYRAQLNKQQLDEQLNKQRLREQYFEQLFKAVNDDPINITKVLEKLTVCDSSDIEKILIFGLKSKNKEIVIKCRERLRKMPAHEKFTLKNLDSMPHFFVYPSTVYPSTFKTSSIEYLIENGADIDKPINHIISPIFSAVAYNKRDVVNMLIEAGANLHVKGFTNGYNGPQISLLQRAILNNNQDMVLDLIKAGCRDDEAFIEAAARGDTDFISAYLKLDVDDTTKAKALMGAIDNEKTKAALCLINAGADVNVAGQDGKSAVWLAVKHQNFDLLKAIQEKGTRADLVSYALFAAIQFNYENMYPELMKAVTSNTINLKNGNDNDNTLLMTSAIYGRVSMVRDLIDPKADLGADLDATNKQGYSALMLAIKHNRVDIALILIEHGARCDLVTPSGETALSLVPNNNKTMLKALHIALKIDFSTFKPSNQFKRVRPLLVGVSKPSSRRGNCISPKKKAGFPKMSSFLKGKR